VAMGCSNLLTGFLNLATFILSIPIIGMGVWLSHTHDTVCVRFLQYPVIALGVFILLVSLAGMIGAWCDKRFLLLIYLFVMFLLIVLLFCFTIFAFVVTNSGAGNAVSGKGYKEYKLGDYSHWLQKRVDDPSYWAKIKSCIADSKVCSTLDTKYKTEAAFDNASLTPLEVTKKNFHSLTINFSALFLSRYCSFLSTLPFSVLFLSLYCSFLSIVPSSVLFLSLYCSFLGIFTFSALLPFSSILPNQYRM
jgi:hypothetical protein